MRRVEVSETLVGLLRRGDPLLALTGAGISAESGLATLRGPGGLWEGTATVRISLLRPSP
jgi:NAD-dependent SIR2 family protein deacetylase